MDFQRRLQNGGWDVGRELETPTGGGQAPHTAYYPSLWYLFMFMFLPSPPYPKLFLGRTCLSFYISKNGVLAAISNELETMNLPHIFSSFPLVA